MAVAILRAQPGSSGCALNRAVQLHQAGDWDGAIREYRACLAAEPNRVEARSNLGAVYAKMGRYQEAIEEYRTALQNAPPDFAMRLRYNLALAYYKASQVPEAIVQLEDVHKQAPGEVNVALLLADCDLRIGDNRKAIELLLPFESAQAENEALAYVLGMALIREGRVAEGQQRVDRILRRGDSAEGHFLLGSALSGSHRYPEAVQEFAKAEALNSNLPSLHSYLGQALLSTGDPDGASAAFRKELEQNPNDYDANFQLASILSVRGKTVEARPYLERAIQVRPSSSEARQALASGFQFKAGAADGVSVGAAAPLVAGVRWSKPTVLVFGSYTCPKLRYSAEALNRLYERYGGEADFRLVYIREAHAGDSQWQSTINERDKVSLQPAATLAEKRANAQVCVRKLKIAYPALTDAMDDAAERAYSAWPSRVYVVDRNGTVAFNSRLGELDFHVEQLEAALRETLTKGVSHGNAR